MSWQRASWVGFWDCSHRENELIAARRWLRVDVLLCRLTSSQFRNPVVRFPSYRVDLADEERLCPRYVEGSILTSAPARYGS
jgi:hypothetical protein